MLNTKSLGRPPSLAHLDKVNSNSLDSCVTIQDLPPKVPPYSKLQDLASSHTGTRLTPSPAPVLHIDSPSSYTSESLNGSPILYPKLSGMHRSFESLPLQMSVPPSSRFITTDKRDKEDRSTGTWGAGSRTSLTLSDRQVSEIFNVLCVSLEKMGFRYFFLIVFVSRVKKHVKYFCNYFEKHQSKALDHQTIFSLFSFLNQVTTQEMLIGQEFNEKCPLSFHFNQL